MVLRSTSFCFVANSSHRVSVTEDSLLQQGGWKMRKAAIALGTVGIGAGILYAFGRARQNNSGKLRAMDGVEKVGESGVESQAPNLAQIRTKKSEATSDSKLPSMSPLKDGSSEAAEKHYEIDDRGTDQSEAVQVLTRIKDEAFDSSDQKLALALGREANEIEAWTRGEQIIDSDVLMKARRLALERGLRIEE